MTEQNYIEDLHPGRSDWILRVKVLSTWFVRGFMKKRDMILADEKGMKIEATMAFQDYQSKIDKNIEEDVWYNLSDFQVIVPKSSRQRNITHEYHIKFCWKTNMIRTTYISKSLFFDEIMFQEIKENIVNKDISFDVFGVIIEISDKERIKLDAIRQDMKEEVDVVRFVMVNNRYKYFTGGDRLRCLVTEHYASGFTRLLNTSGYKLKYKRMPLFCVLRFWRIAFHEGEICIVNGHGCSQIFLDPEFDELMLYKLMYWNYALAKIHMYKNGEEGTRSDSESIGQNF